MPNMAQHYKEISGEKEVLYESSRFVETTSYKISFADLEDIHQLMNAPLIDGLIRIGETANLIASPKVGKSWMVYHLALSIVAGLNWLDFPTNQGKVLLIDNELHPSTLRQRIQWVAEALQIDGTAWKHNLEIWPLRGNLKSLEELSMDLLEDTQKGFFKLIILDAKYRFANTRGDENSNAAEACFYNEIDRLAEKTGAAILLVHHATKGSQADKRVTDVGAGAGAQARAADCHLVIREHEQAGAFVLQAAVRSFAPVKARVIRFRHPMWSIDERLDVTKLAGRMGKGQAARSKQDAAEKDQILNVLRTEGKLSNRKLRERIGCGKDKMDRLLGVLVSEQLITKHEGIVRGNQCYEYEIKR